MGGELVSSRNGNRSRSLGRHIRGICPPSPSPSPSGSCENEGQVRIVARFQPCIYDLR